MQKVRMVSRFITSGSGLITKASEVCWQPRGRVFRLIVAVTSSVAVAATTLLLPRTAATAGLLTAPQSTGI